MQTQPLVVSGSRPLHNLVVAFAGSFLIALMAHVTIPLPFTPVPVTGQTFAVAFLALCLGRRRATLAVLMYLAEGALGLPVFAMGTTGFAMGPTSGYLLGMLLSAMWVGYCADRNWACTWTSAFLVCLSGSVLVFGCGLAILSLFIPANSLLLAGFFPFALGDFVKNVLASGLYVSGKRLSAKA